MTRLRIVNASPLILLGKIRRLELLFVGEPKVIVPRTTLAEVTSLPVATSLPGWHSGLPGITVVPDVSIPPEVIRHALDPGESMVLALALSSRARGDEVDVVLDERKGRRAAAALGLSLVGTAGLVLRAKAEGVLAAPESVRDVLNSLEREGMYLGLGLRAAILEAADE
jgi:predicted nucleic acid-binding protein